MLAFVFPGQGSQTAGMGRKIADQYPVARQVFEQADDVLGYSISKLCFEGPEDELALTANSQPAILTTSIAVLRALQQETGISPDMAAGHSLGEYSALVCAESMRFEDAVRIVNRRGTYMQEAVPVGQGAMAAIMGSSTEVVEELCRDAAQGQVLCPANFNTASQIVIAGHADAVARAITLAGERGAVARKLKVSAPFHCPLMKPAADKLAPELKACTISDPKIPVISNVDAEPNLEGARVADLLIRQITASVRWEASINRMVELGVKEVVEVGGNVLSSMIRRIDKSLKLSQVQEPEQIEDHLWTTREDGARVSRDGTKITWPDGLSWDFNDPKAHGF